MLELIHPYAMKTLIANNIGTNSKPLYGDIYDSLTGLLQDHPNCENYTVGFCIIDTNTGLIAAGTADWYDLPQEAFDAFEKLLDTENSRA